MISLPGPTSSRRIVSRVVRFTLPVLLTCQMGVAFAQQVDPPAKPGSGDSRSSSKDTTPKKKPPKPFAWVNALPEDHVDALKHATFHSRLLDVEVGYCILLPPSYTVGDTSRRYPVVYYLHGGRPGNESKSHRLAAIMDESMRGDDAVGELIYVFVNGGPVSHYNVPDRSEARGADVFINELIPHVDANYRTIAARSARGLEGFSQGGRGTMRLSLRYPELFATAAAGGGGYETEKKISESGGFENPDLKFAAGDNVWDLAKTYAAGSRPKVEWMIYVGADGSNYANNLRYMEYLDELGVTYVKLIVPDVDHSGFRIYEQRAKTIMRFHADRLQSPVSSVGVPRK